MKILYLDCVAGISGDMFLGALLDLGLSVEALGTALAGLGLEGYVLEAEKVSKNGLAGTKATVRLLREERLHRHLPEILRIIEISSLPAAVKEKAVSAFRCLAAAEAKVHGISEENVHFHEVGATDAIVDIVGTLTALHMLGVEKVCCSPLPLGSGFVQCAHGTLPLPAPAVLEILKGVPIAACDVAGETVTPTGAALVKTLAEHFGPLPAMKIQSVGYGAGLADRPVPNLLRVIMGETQQSLSGQVEGPVFEEDNLIIAEAGIDDMNPEFYDYILPELFSAGAVDAFVTPVMMKKGRPAQVITCLVPENALKHVVGILLCETTTLGVRTFPCRRFKLARETIPVQTRYGQVTVKLGREPGSGRIMNVAPEWEDCKATAQKNRVPVKTVYDLAKAAAYQLLSTEPGRVP